MGNILRRIDSGPKLRIYGKGSMSSEDIGVPRLKEDPADSLECPFCSVTIPWTKKLETAPCPNCSAKIYYPMRLKEYVLYKPLGGGGAGQVFKAFKPGSLERFAVKTLLGERRSDLRGASHIINEGKAGKQIGEHRNLIPVLDFGEDGGIPYILMPFIAGERLDHYIQRKKRLSEMRALNMTKQIVDAEIFIVSKGYLFRDLKPENIILEPNGDLRLFDYGLCIPKSEAAAKDFVPDDFEGSPFYIPPERIVGASEGEYSEIYSLGMILFHMLKGHPYFSETEIGELISKHVNSLRTLSVQGLLKNCSPQLVAMIDKMIARKPDARYLDFASLNKDLDNAIALVSASASVQLRGMKKSGARIGEK